MTIEHAQLSVDPRTCNLASLLEARAALQPDAAALIEGEAVLRFGALSGLVGALAGGLSERGVRPGDRVAVRCEKSATSIALFFAVLRLGAVYVPINTALTPAERAFILADARPVLVVATLAEAGEIALDDLLAGPRRAPPPVAPGGHAPSVMLYTSGTTGRPKGAVLSHRNLAVNFVLLAEAWEITPADEVLHVLPVFHGHGLFLAAACPLIAGARLRLHARFDIDAAIAALGTATVLMAVPTIHARLLDHPAFTRERAAGLRLVTSGSAPLPLDVADAFAARTGIVLLERYGSTEGGMIASNPLHGARRRGSVGPAFAEVECRMIDAAGAEVAPGEVGRLLVRSPYVGLGYWAGEAGMTPITDAEGWFDTGDLVKRDADGYLFIVGRDKDMIISGGFNVYPREVEMALESLPEIAEAAVVGVPHPDFGEAVLAVVAPRSGQPLDMSAVNARLATQLAGYKRPKRIEVIDAMPRNAMGKIVKRELRDRFLTAFQAS
ncbi:MAG: AMP-binding protein [Rhodobacteraceae bacterium]|nr:AMP-binding protein [Paracoccaceae bacterium]